MKSLGPTIDAYMTPMPHSVGVDQTLATARTLMQRHHVRHLPVLRAGKLVGVLTSRDIDYLNALRDVDPERVTVEEAMSQEPFTVAPGAPLDEVALVMAQERYGCALVVADGKVIGIFTTVDGMRVLGETLRRATAHDALLPPSRRKPSATRTRRATR